jgi:hypothetical protein
MDQEENIMEHEYLGQLKKKYQWDWMARKKDRELGELVQG